MLQMTKLSTRLGVWEMTLAVIELSFGVKLFLGVLWEVLTGF